jgi:hypothetical protein
VAYEMFENKSVRVDTPALSITPGGRIAINAAAGRLLMEAGIKTVVIFWDRAKHRMAIKAAPRGERNSFAVTFTRGQHSATFAAKSFLRHIGWSATKRETLDTTWNDAEKMFEATLPVQFLPAGSGAAKGRVDK